MSAAVSSLREQLARRLATEYRRSQGWNEPEVHWGDRDDANTDPTTARDHRALIMAWERVADECLRQMEWVRHKYLLERIQEGRHDAPRWAYEVYAAVRDGDLTIAPEDWKP